MLYYFVILGHVPSTYQKKLTLKSPQADPSANVTEEGIATIGDDSSLHVIGPEGLPEEQDV